MLRWFQGWQVSTLTCCGSLSITSVANFTWLFSKFFFLWPDLLRLRLSPLTIVVIIIPKLPKLLNYEKFIFLKFFLLLWHKVNLTYFSKFSFLFFPVCLSKWKCAKWSLSSFRFDTITKRFLIYYLSTYVFDSQKEKKSLFLAIESLTYTRKTSSSCWQCLENKTLSSHLVLTCPYATLNYLFIKRIVKSIIRVWSAVSAESGSLLINSYSYSLKTQMQIHISFKLWDLVGRGEFQLRFRLYRLWESINNIFLF